MWLLRYGGLLVVWLTKARRIEAFLCLANLFLLVFGGFIVILGPWHCLGKANESVLLEDHLDGGQCQRVCFMRDDQVVKYQL